MYYICMYAHMSYMAILELNTDPVGSTNIIDTWPYYYMAAEVNNSSIIMSPLTTKFSSSDDEAERGERPGISSSLLSARSGIASLLSSSLPETTSLSSALS